jgi:UDP-N-acetylglucosamine diphosphorylase / glucose-1-phosphate thymidylyltransferase / UDP-N-acetylgalactosamine diphosphorylase / glucosamine-1-phosphate N-acetyltransferase / galactosamine-1-phosphate N-acetyltransferase
VAFEVKKAVLLAAGRGRRLGELTAKTPKPLLDIAGAPVIAHIVHVLERADIREFGIVVGYRAEMMEDWCRAHVASNPHIMITPIRQPELSGTGGAMLAAESFLAGEERFVFGWGDILMDRANYPRFVEHARYDEFDLLLAANRVKDPFRGAAVYIAPDQRVERLDEKPAEGTAKTEWNNAGLFAADQRLFEYLRQLERSERGEYELPQAISKMIADGLVVRAVEMRGFWSDIGTPADVESARALFKPMRTR